MPEHRAATLRIDEDDGAAVRCITVDRLAHVDASAFQRIPDQPSMIIRSEHAKITAAQPERSAGRSDSRRLASAEELAIFYADLSARQHSTGLDRQL